MATADKPSATPDSPCQAQQVQTGVGPMQWCEKCSVYLGLGQPCFAQSETAHTNNEGAPEGGRPVPGREQAQQCPTPSLAWVPSCVAEMRREGKLAFADALEVLAASQNRFRSDASFVQSAARLKVDQVCGGRCDLCEQGHGYTEKSKDTFVFHDVGGSQLPCDARDIRLLAASLSAPSSAPVASEVQALRHRVIEAAYRPSPMCRDCADRDGTCYDGTKCDPFEAALDVLRASVRPAAALALADERFAELQRGQAIIDRLKAGREKVLTRRCTNPKPVGDSACECCTHHWYALGEGDEPTRTPSASGRKVNTIPLIRRIQKQREELAEALRNLVSAATDVYVNEEPTVEHWMALQAAGHAAEGALVGVPTPEQQLRNIAAGLDMTYEELIAGIEASAADSRREDV